MSIEIRLATKDDLPFLFDLDKECFPEGSSDLEPAPKGEIEAGVSNKNSFVAILNQNVIGMMQLGKTSSNDWELITLAITKNQRGSGLGKKFMKQLLEETQKSPYLVRVSCVTSPNNIAMQSLLEKNDFIQSELLSDYFGPGKNRLRFVLN
jgi:ribosomal protein S18 acetylase RimI-like enzyme